MTARSARADATTLSIQFYLVISSSGSVHTTMGAPRLAANEIAIRQSVKVPRALFTRPSLSAEVVIPNEAAMPTEIEATTVSDIREAVLRATGIDLSITVEKAM